MLKKIAALTVAVSVAGFLVGTPQHCVAQVAAPEVAAPTVSPPVRLEPGTLRQQQWLKATPDQKILLAESLGEDGARAFAKSKGWEPISDGTNRGIRQGLDQVYREADGTIHAIEAKGGTGQLGHGYGHPQGSSEWAVEAAKSTLRSSSASTVEKSAAEAVLKAAAQGKLCIHVVRTSHVDGEPIAAVLRQTIRGSEAASKVAQTTLDDLARASAHVVDDAAHVVDDAARVAASGSKATTALRAVAKGAVVFDVVVRVSDGLETERKFAAGEISVQEREVSHAKNAAGMAGGMGGAAGGAWIAGATVAPVAVMTGPAAPYVEGTAVFAGGIAGYFVGEKATGAAAEWTVNRVHKAGSTVGGAAKSAWSATANSASSAWSWATNW